MKINKNKLDYFMAKKQLSKEELSKLSGVSTKTLHRIGDYDFLPKTIGKIACGLGVEIENIIDTEI